jgi:Ohr subfamily peroxiredoxin
MTTKIISSGTTHVTAGADGAARSNDGFLDIKLPQPHPAAENLFGAAWSTCYLGALELAAGQRGLKLSGQSVDTQIDLNHAGGAAFFLSARLAVSLPGLERDVAEALIEAAHVICPYSKAVHGNIEIVTTLA